MGIDNHPVYFDEPPTVSAVMNGNMSGITLDRPRVIVDVNLLIVDRGRVLLGRRSGTGFADGNYGLPAGHLELGESVIVAAAREAREELNIEVEHSDLNFVQVMHNSYGIGRIALFFEVKKWAGDIVNCEPEKCDDLRWFTLSCLPDNIVPHIRTAIDCYLAGRALTLYGW